MNAFTHIAFSCRNQAAQETFYTKHLGFKRSRTFKRGTPDEFFLLKLGAMRLEFFKCKHPDVATAKGGEQTLGFRHVAFDVPKLEPIIASLRADGVEPDPIVECDKLVPGMRIVFFRDPEGNIIELMEGYRDEE